MMFKEQLFGRTKYCDDEGHGRYQLISPLGESDKPRININPPVISEEKNNSTSTTNIRTCIQPKPQT